MPAYLFKLVYDEGQNRAWAHRHINDNATRASGVCHLLQGRLMRLNTQLVTLFRQA